jgi:acyl-CoA thioesterase-2
MAEAARPSDSGAERRPDPVGHLIELLDLDDLGGDRFGTPNPERGFGPRVFGGQVVAQALRAASYTVAEHLHLHSLHAYFLLAGTPGVPITYEVDRIRDGRSFSTRRVVARQDDRAIFNFSCSYHRGEPGVDYQLPIARGIPLPDDAPDDMGIIPESARDLIPMEFRDLGATPADDEGYFRSTRRVWMRIRRRLPDDPDLHTAMITFLSDMGAVMAARAPLAEQPLEKLMGASLDHSMWFHRPMRADEWFLYDMHAVSNASARGLAFGTLHTVDGVLGVSLAQEALLRIIDRDGAPTLEVRGDEA